jgi:hypothetical protein
MRGMDDDGDRYGFSIVDYGRRNGGERVKLLHKDGDWQLLDATDGRYNVGQRAWQSVIKHWCHSKGSPYWMLLEHASTPTCCVYCKTAMPDSIVALFKLQNWECIR